MIYQEAYYSNEADVPEQAREYAGREFKLESSTIPWLPDFDPKGDLSSDVRTQDSPSLSILRGRGSG